MPRKQKQRVRLANGKIKEFEATLLDEDDLEEIVKKAAEGDGAPPPQEPPAGKKR
jgi:hypothetical protein